MRKVVHFVGSALKYAAVLVIAFVLGTSVITGINSGKNTVKAEPAVSETVSEEDSSVPREYRNALRSAENYSELMHMSKQGIYDQLTSEYGDKFPAEAAQYAVDHLDVDYYQNALESAKNYSEMMGMSDREIYDQLISEYGEKFTPEEAQYALDHLDD